MTNRKLLAKRYLIVEHIGKGGMADVYLAVDMVLNREVAIKILKDDLSNDEIALQRFSREANASTYLSHPNIVDIYDVGDDGNNHFIVMEYIKGITLKQLIKKRGPLSYKEAILMMKQLCSAIMESHRNGIIHRDIKSQNVLIKSDGTVKVVDFGIALANNAMQITSEDSVLGSVHYMAPEIAKGEVATMQSDIYSLGIVFYELLTGMLPYNGDGAIQVVLDSIKKEMPSVLAYDHKILQSIDNIVLKATAKNKENRYQNVALMIKDLNECLDEKHLNDKKIVFEHSEHISFKDVVSNNKPKKDYKKYLIGVLFAFVSIIITISMVFILYISGIISFGNKNVMVPDILKMKVLEASEVLNNNGLILDLNSIKRVLTSDTAAGLIIEVEPSVGETIQKGSSIKVVVSDGIIQKVDDYVGLDIEDARKKLANYPNIRLIETSEISDKPSGIIISQTLLDANSEIDPNKNYTIKLTYSEFPSIIIPFEIKGAHKDDATWMLENMNMQFEFERIDFEAAGLKEDDKEKYPSMTIVKCEPDFGTYYTQTKDSKIKLYYVEY